MMWLVVESGLECAYSLEDDENSKSENDFFRHKINENESGRGRTVREIGPNGNELPLIIVNKIEPHDSYS